MNTPRQRLFDINGFEDPVISNKLLIKNDADMIAGMGGIRSGSASIDRMI